MVGLYHKRRARLRAQNKTMRYLGNVAYVVGIVVVVLVLIIGIFFTGSRVKTPLASLLSAKSGLAVTIEDAEFSPLYPNVIKLYNVSFGNSLIGEFYLEYELGSLFSDQELRIRDIYINKLQLNPHDLEKVATSQFGYESVHADMVRFHHTPLHTQYLQSDDATIRLNDVRFSHERGLSFHTGVVSTEQAQFFARPIKGLTVEFTSHERGLSLDHFSLNMLGGVISGNGIYDLHGDKSLNYDTASATADAESKFTGADISLEELNLSKIVIQDELPTAPAVSLEAKRVNLSDVIFSRSDPDTKSATATTAANHSGAADTASSSTSPTTAQTTANSVATATNTEVNNSFLLQGINGTLQNLRLDDQHFAGMFSGEVDVLSLPQVQTTFEHNKGKARLSSDGVDFAFQGSLYEGDYSLSGSLNYADKTLTLDDVVLHKNKLAINPPRLSFLEQNLGEYTVNLGTARFSNMEFLSFINAFPVSVASISGQAQNLSLVPVASARADTAAASNPATTTDASSDAALAASSAVASLRQLGAHLQPYKPNHDLHASLATLRENAFPNDAQDDADTEQGNGIPALPQGQSLLQWYLQDSLYSNLLMRHIKGTLTVGSASLHLELPEVLFQESTLQADALLSRELTVPSTLRLTAKDFESADLNSNLIGHFLTGKFDLDLSLQEQLGTAPAASETPTDTAAALVSAATSDAAASESSDVASNSAEAVDTAERMATQQLLLSGYIDLKSEAMLIADFGLDLINGGKQRNFTLTGTELLTAIQGSVAGISDLRWHTMFTDGVAQSNGQLGLATANMRFTGSANTLSHEVTGEAELISLARDSRTRVALTGTWDKSVYHLTALSRGVDRPGLYLPQYEASAVAKEQTDAAAVLKGLIKREELIPEQMKPEAQEHAQEELSLIDQALQEQQQQTESDSAASSTSESDSDSAVTTAPAPEAKSDDPTSTPNEATEVTPPASEIETTATAPSAETGTPPDSVDATVDSTTNSADAADEGIPITADDYVTTGVADPVPDANDKKSATEAGTGSATETTTTTTAPAPATESDDSSAPTDATAVTSPAAEDEDEDENASKDAMTTAESVTHTDDSTSTEAATDATDEGIPITADDYVITGFEQPPLVPAPTDGDESTEEKAPSAEESADAEPTATDSDNVTANTLAPSPSGTADTGTPSASAPAPATVSSSTPQITHTEPDTATDTHSTEATTTTTTTTTTPQEHALADTENLPTAQELEAERLRRLKQADDFELNLLQDAFFDSLRDRGEQDEGEDYHYDEDSDDLLF